MTRSGRAFPLASSGHPTSDEGSGSSPTTGLIFPTVVSLNADLAHGANTMAIVISDAPSLNGVYQKSGASGVGAWTRVADLPSSVIPFTVSGGTANAPASEAHPAASMNAGTASMRSSYGGGTWYANFLIGRHWAR